MHVITRAAIAPVLAAPTVRAEQVTQLVLGETADIWETRGEWRRVRLHADGYEGWVNEGYLREVDEAAVREWNATALAWSTGARVDVGGHVVALPLRARVALANGVVHLPDGRTGRVVSGTVSCAAELAAAARRVSVQDWALEHFEGAPYQWGGVTPAGVDCSGLVQTTFAARGIRLPRDSSVQAGSGAPVALDAIRPGDLLFFHSETSANITHVAFAGTDDTLIHSTISCGGVLVESRKPGTRAAALWNRLVAARRIPDGPSPDGPSPDGPSPDGSGPDA